MQLITVFRMFEQQIEAAAMLCANVWVDEYIATYVDCPHHLLFGVVVGVEPERALAHRMVDLV